MSFSQSQSNQYPSSSIKYFQHQQSQAHTKSKGFNSNSKIGLENSNITNTHTTHKRKPLTVFDKLYEKAQERLNRLKTKIIDSEKQKEESYSFTPLTNRRKNRHLSSNVIERGEIWIQSRKKTQVNAQQQEMLKKMKDCTFTPKLNRRVN